MDIKEKADALIEKHRPYAYTGVLVGEDETTNATKCAILSVEHTIDVLNNIYFKTQESAREIDYAIYEQTELLTELKSRI